MIDWTAQIAPSLDDIAVLARAAFDALPPEIRAAAGDVEFHTQDFAQEDVLAELGLENPFELSGLYDGVDRMRQSVFDVSPHVSRVFLFRRPLLDEWAEHDDLTLGDLVRHVLVHEIGHHFGLSDADIVSIEASDD